MSSLGSPNPFFIAGKKAYEIDRSLRFNDDDGAYLQETAGTPTNNKIWTYSVWVKRTTLSGDQAILVGYSNGGSFDQILFSSSGGRNNQIFMQFNNSGTYGQFTSTRAFRDVGAWGHLVIKADTTAGSNGVTVYWNNEVVAGTWNVTLAQDATFHSLNQSGDNFRIGHLDSGVANHYLDGYLAEINFVDGSALLPSSFGETDVITGQWNPKKYTGSYGTNGFYLNFSTDTLGTDRSGNGNDFTPNNFSVVAGVGNDALEDTPTNNFCTLNPLFNDNGRAEPNFANGNLDIDNTGGGDLLTHGTFAVKSGKYYFEAVAGGVSSDTHFIGIQQEQPSNSVVEGLYRSDGRVYDGSGSESASGTTYSSGNTVGVAFDATTGKVWFAVNNTWISSGDPANGNNPAFTWSTTNHITPALAFDNTSNGKTWVANFGQRVFTYTPPTGFEKLNSANLPDPTIKLPNQHFNTILYTGDDSNDRDITGVGFQPDWLWIKNREGPDWNNLTNAVAGANRQMYSNETDGESVDNSNGHVNSYLADGFNVTAGNSGNVNENNEDYVAWNWNAGDTDGKTYTVTVVDDSGNKFRFDGFAANAVTLDLAEGGTYIFNYPSGHPFRFSTTSDGTHGGGSEYTTGVTHNSSTQVTIVVAASAPTLYYYCSSHSGMGGQINTNSTLGSSNFDGTIQSVVKASPTAGFSIINYTGNGSNGATIGHGLGVTPNHVIWKERGGAENWINWQTQLGDNALLLNLSNSQISASGNNLFIYGDFNSTSLKLGNADQTNRNGDTYVSYCFSEVAGYSKFGSYIGNGSNDGTFVFTGFRPAFVLIKSSSNTENWYLIDNKRPEYNGALGNTGIMKWLKANTGDSENQNGLYNFLANGFKLGYAGADTNGNGRTYIYLAFAEAPFKNARAR